MAPKLRVAALAGLLIAVPANAEPAQSPAAFQQDMVQRMRRLYPEAKVEPAGELAASLTFPDNEPSTANFDRIFAFCATAEPADCEATKQQFAEGSRDIATKPVITRQSLRLIVRGADYLAQLEKLGDAGTPPPIQRPIAKGMGVLLMADFPRTTASVNLVELGKLGLSEEAALQLARDQVLERLPEVPTALELKAGMLLPVEAEYAESLLLKSDRWAKLDADTRGQLFVAVPGANLLLVGIGTDADVERLAGPIAQLSAESQRPISPLVYRWRDGGWTAAETAPVN